MRNFKRLFITILAMLLMFTMIACIDQPDTETDNTDTTSTNNNTTDNGYKDGVIGENKDAISNDITSSDKFTFDAAEGDAPTASDKSEISSDYTNVIQSTAGTLTAGEWRDTDNIADWIGRFDDTLWRQILKDRELCSTNIIVVNVTDGENPVYNQVIHLYTEDETLLYTAKTDVFGKAYLFYPTEYVGQKLSVDIDDIWTTFVATGYDEHHSKQLPSNAIEELDLMLMIDTTGSMGDELEYIKTELVDMVERIADAGKTYSIRVSVNFYRDEGDEYIVKYFDFRTDINECLEQISAQRASGGGDYPEAVHTALDNAINGHEWRENAIKLCFFVLDAPPHSELEVQGINQSIIDSIEKSAELGIKIIPVASSGVDTETEIILRSFAVMTGGTYVFLTNDSGIGNDHLEPTVGEHTIEPLNECMIRIVCEYCGLDYIPQYTFTPAGNE